MTPDPFTHVLLRLWECLEAHAPLTSLVKLGNRIKRLQSASDAVAIEPKQDVLSSDLPELDIVPAGASSVNDGMRNLVIEQTFEVQVAVEGARLDEAYFPVFWECIVALSKHGGCNLNLPFVERFTIGNYTNEENSIAVLRGNEGWSALLTVTVKMRFNISNL